MNTIGALVSMEKNADHVSWQIYQYDESIINARMNYTQYFIELIFKRPF